MSQFGVKVLCIEPGFFKTNVTNCAILTKNIQMLWDRLPQEVRDDYGPEYLPKSKCGSSPHFLIHLLILTAPVFPPSI